MDVLTIVKRSPFVVPLACLATAAMVFISEGSYWQAAGTLDALGTMATARLHIQSLERDIQSAETGRRIYLLSGDSEYRKPYDNALIEIGESLGFLRRHYSADPTASAVVDQLSNAIETARSELALSMQPFDAGKRKTSAEIARNAIGKEQMDAIHTLSAELLEHESRSVDAGRSNIYQTLMLSRIGVAVLSGFSLLALALYLRQGSLLDRQRQEQQHLVQVERDSLEGVVVQRTAQLTELAHHLQTAREDERGRLARDLHDELGAFLTSAKLDAARIKSRLAGTAPEALERLGHLIETLNSGIAMKRRIIEDLRPSALDNLGLVAALEILAREFAEQSGIEVHQALEPVELEADAELVVFRLVQEALTNIAKYAKAKQVWVSLAMQDGHVQVSVRDDGVGFDTTAQSTSAHGIVGMRFRVEAEGGSLTLQSAPGRARGFGFRCRPRRWFLPESLPPLTHLCGLARSSAHVCGRRPTRVRLLPHNKPAVAPIAFACSGSETRSFAANPVANPQARCKARRLPDRSFVMLHYAVVFFVIALIAALFGFGGIAASAVGIAKILFIVFAVLTVASLLFGLIRSS